MALTNTFITIIDGVIWVVCLLLGMVIGSFLGKYVGTFLGWLVANSLDENIIRGGVIGEQFGKFAGVALGVGLSVYGALQATTFIAHTIAH